MNHDTTLCSVCRRHSYNVWTFQIQTDSEHMRTRPICIECRSRQGWAVRQLRWARWTYGNESADFETFDPIKQFNIINDNIEGLINHS